MVLGFIKTVQKKLTRKRTDKSNSDLEGNISKGKNKQKNEHELKKIEFEKTANNGSENKSQEERADPKQEAENNCNSNILNNQAKDPEQCDRKPNIDNGNGNGNEVPDDGSEIQSLRSTYIAAFCASLFTLCNALNWAWLGIVIMKLQDPDAPFPITDAQTAYLHHASQVTSLLGTFLIIPLTNYWGRKNSLLVAVIPYCIMSIIYYFGNSFEALFVARVIAGISSGSIGTIVHVYLSEISPAERRGKISSMSSVQASFGHLIGIIVIPLLTMQQSAVMLFVYPFIAIPFFWKFSPETPYFYVLRNNRVKALESIRKLNCDESHVDRMFQHKEEVESNAKLTDLLTVRGNRKSLGYAAVLHFSTAFTGIGPIAFYITLIFKRESTFSWYYSLIILNVTGLLTNFVSGGLADKFGRRPLLLCSCLTTSVLLGTLGAYFYLKQTMSPEMLQIFQFTPLIGYFLFQITLHLGLAQVNRLASSELFPTHLRTSSSAIRKVFGTVLSVVAIQVYQFLSSHFGLWWCFWFFGCMTVINGIVAYTIFPETKGKTFEEIQMMLHKDD